MKSLLLAALLFACCLHTYGIRPNLSLPQVSTVVEDLARSPRQRIIGIEGSQAAYRQAFSGAQGMSAVLIGTQTNKTSNSVYDIVEEEALVAEYTATWLVSHVQRGIRAVSKAIRVASDTVTGLLTGSIKLFGGFFNMVASLFDSLSSRIRNRDSSSWLLRPFDKFAGNSANTFNKTGRFFHTVGNTLLVTGDFVESTAVDILQALQYSYASLDSLCDVAKVIISQSLDVDNSVLVLNYTIAGDEVVNSTNFEASQNKSFVDDSYSACDESHRNNSNNNIWTFDSMKNSTSEVLETFAGVVSSTAVDAVGYLVHFLFNFVHDFIVVPVRSTSDEPSIGVHIAICLLILSGVGAVEFKSAKTKRRTLFFLYACMWLYLIALESHQRARLVKRSSMKAVNSYLKLKIHHTSSSLKRTVISNDTVDEPTPQKKRFWNFFNLKVGDQSIDQSTSPNDQDYTLFEETVWGNALLSSIWYVDNGGIGPYISDTLAEVINAELSLVPPGVANLHLRKFTLGSSPPLIKGMRAFVERDDVNYTMSDLQGHIVSNSSGNTTINDGRAPSPSSETINSSLWQVSTFSSLVNLGRSQIRNGSDELEPMASRLSNASIQSNSTNTDFTESGSTQETLENYLKSNNSTDGHFKDYAVWKYNVTNNGSTNPSSREIANDNMYDEDPHSEDDGIDPELMMDNLSDSDTQYQRWFSYSIAKLFKSQLPKWAYNSLLGIVDSSERNRTSAITFEQLRNFESQSDFLSHSESDRLVLDIDFVYCSKDMDIVVALRSPNVKSALPEASFRLSELMFSGKLRINSSLTADFPFLGNASLFLAALFDRFLLSLNIYYCFFKISFLEVPQLDFTVQSFGGIDIASIPLAFYWVNTTMTWLLQQFTYPLSTEIDLRHNICPACDSPPEPTAQEVLREIAQNLANGAQHFIGKSVQYGSKVVHSIDSMIIKRFTRSVQANSTHSNNSTIHGRDKRGHNTAMEDVLGEDLSDTMTYYADLL